MKKFLVLCLFLVTTTFLFISCYGLKKVRKNNKVEQTGNKKMTRIKTASGLEYEIIKEGSGKSPQKGDTVVVHYTGWLNKNGEPGEKFDSSVDRGKPFSFPIGMEYVIKGWDEGVITMKVGEKRRLFIPADLGYGKYGAGSVIPPDANLIFDVELLQII